METEIRNFDYWLNLVQTDPARYECERRVVLEEAIRKAPERKQLQGRHLLQRIEEARVSDPLLSTIIAFKIMAESVSCLSDEWLNLSVASKRAKAEYQTGLPLKGEEVIDFLTKEK
jgi:hypothetical protein